MALYAAVDIGSNSVRLAVADASPGAYRLLDSDREVTRIGESVFTSGRVSQQAIDHTCEVLRRFAQTCEKWQPQALRAAATSALRDARNQQEFLDRAATALGTPIEIISGLEEARLIHLGVLARWPRKEKRLLLLDIGGGSAEVTLSRNGNIRYTTSLPLGAIRLTQNFLRHDPPEPEEIAELQEYVEQQFAASRRRLSRHRAARAIGTSATAGAVIAAVNRIKGSGRERLDGRRARLPEIRRLYRQLLELDVEGRQRLPGIGPRRAEIITAGAAVLLSFVQHLTNGAIYYSEAGLRDGLISDLAARGVTAEDSRLDKDQLRTVAELARRYGVSPAHAQQVAKLSQQLFAGLASLHRLPTRCARWLEAAAYLHDVGHYVSSTRHHRHSYYLVAHSDMPGFSDREHLIVANLCRYHRKALPEDHHENFDLLKPEEKKVVRRLLPLLRVADGLDRGHRALVSSVACRVEEGEARLTVAARPGIELDCWAARQAAEAFRKVYDVKLTVTSVC